jgi:NADH:ubiquinone oxidoreductase subunit E
VKHHAKDIEEIMETHPPNPEHLIAVLQDVQAEYHYISGDNLTLICDYVGVPLTRAWAVATFFKAFSLQPRGEHEIKVCTGTACHLKGSEHLVENLSRVLGIKPGETTTDLNFSLDTVNCLGACALAPVAVVDEIYYPELTSKRLNRIIRRLSVR